MSEPEELAALAAALSCSQCGQVFSARACGPTHAIIQADPRRHRLIAPLIRRDKRIAWEQGYTRAVLDGVRELERADNPYETDTP